MKHLLLTLLFLLLTSVFVEAQTVSVPFKGIIKNFSNQFLFIYQCYGDTVLPVDSAITDKEGKFEIALTGLHPGLYQVNLLRNQSFYFLYEGKPIELQTVFSANAFYNIATDSLKVLKSEDNKRFYEFQNLQMKLNIANHFLLQMMRLYPLPDPFHKQIEDEYFMRYTSMNQFVKSLKYENMNAFSQSMSAKIALAFYLPVNPDWKEPDPWRDSIIADHYFDYFNPADSFYLHTNILPEKMNMYLNLRTNKRDAYGQPVKDEILFAMAAEYFLKRFQNDRDLHDLTFNFCLNYFLKKFNKDHFDNALLYLYDHFIKNEGQSCEPSDLTFNWVREKVNILRNIQIGSIAPDFEIEKGSLRMSSLPGEYTLLIFWASWCPHCTKEIPEIKKTVDLFNQKNAGKKTLITVAISLDTEQASWKKCIHENDLSTWLNTSELKGWKGDVPKKYNVYATPTMFLLDKNKKIIAKPMDIEELKRNLI